MTQPSYRDLARGRSGYPYPEEMGAEGGTHAVSAEAEVLQSCSGSLDSASLTSPHSPQPGLSPCGKGSQGVRKG